MPRPWAGSKITVSLGNAVSGPNPAARPAGQIPQPSRRTALFVPNFLPLVAPLSRFGKGQNMSLRAIWVFGVSIFCVLMMVTLGGFAGAAELGGQTGLVKAALDRTKTEVRYDPAYVSIPYPMGDVPADRGVCTDVVIRSYRALGIDLQQLVHEDMTANFAAYPPIWGLARPDPNIDHRRVPNLQTFLTRAGAVLSVTSEAGDYLPGDLVTWEVPPHLPHIGIVVNQLSADGQRPLIVHNIGRGPELEDMLFRFPITGHYRFDGNVIPG